MAFPSRDRPAIRANDPYWKSWQELTVKILRLPRNIQPLDVYRFLVHHGLAATVARIEIADQPAFADSVAFVTFDPPPDRAFWQETIRYPGERPNTFPELRMDLLNNRRTYMHRSPVDPDHEYPERLVLLAQRLDFGFMVAEDSMMIMKSVQNEESLPIKFVLNLQHRELHIEFSLKVSSNKDADKDRYRFRIPFSKMGRMQELIRGEQRELIISLPSSPFFFSKVRDIESTFDSGRSWNERNTWVRETDIVENRAVIDHTPVTLKNENAVVDIGRWTTYHFVFGPTKDNRANYRLIVRALSDFNIPTVSGEGISYTDRADPTIWALIDSPKTDSSALSALLGNFTILDFEVRYQLEVCVSHGYLNEHNLTREFIDRLASLGPSSARNRLEKVADLKRRVYNPMDIFDMHVSGGSSSKRIPAYCCWTRAATVTPTMIYYASPTVETSNRVIRAHSSMEDRFLRVKFTDEKDEGRINGRHDRQQDEILRRIKRTMQQGIVIGNRHYEFLAFGNSQFREHSVYFFAPTPEWDADNIRIDMGTFRHIREVAKNAARMGQCFSTTRAVRGIKVNIKPAEDVVVQYNGKGLIFTDGVGKMSLFLAQMISSEFGFPSPFEDPPSVFQFRLGGCKGILAVAPDAVGKDIYIRESQYKFPALQEGLEIIRVSSFATATLNRQIILVLSALGVADQVFLKMQQNMLVDFETAMQDHRVALRLLQKNIDPNQMTLTLASMILDGFMESAEPFMMSVLQLWRAWNIKYLKEKARIYVEKGAFVFGCIDETSTLRGHIEPTKPDELLTKAQKLEVLPEIFLRISDPSNRGVYRVVTGICILARNPSLHPGDVRIVRAVDVPALNHLKNVVVLPCTGDRPLSNMCSGGDLDGDDYLVIWDPELMPDEINHPAMDFTGAEPIRVDREVTVDDRIEFFLTYIKNDNLGRIAHAHLAQADYCEDGVKDPKCLALAELHSTAVDFPKTGVPANMTRELAPKRWPHFMEKNHKPKEKIYHSKKVLGQLYDQVERVDFVPKYDLPFDPRILNAYELSDDILQQAAEVKAQYDAAVRRIMAKHAIRTEFEVWSTLVLEHNRESGDYKFGEEMGYITSSLKDRFKTLCIEKAGGKDFERLGPFVAAMYTVTAHEMAAALAECREVKLVAGREVPVRKMDVESMPFMSFPWLFVSELGRIANGGAASHGQSLVAVQGMQKLKHTRKDSAAVQEQPEGELLALFDDDPDSGVSHAIPAKHLPDSRPPESDAPRASSAGSLLDLPDDDSDSSSALQALTPNQVPDENNITLPDRGNPSPAILVPRRQKFSYDIDYSAVLDRAPEDEIVQKLQNLSINEAPYKKGEAEEKPSVGAPTELVATFKHSPRRTGSYLDDLTALTFDEAAGKNKLGEPEVTVDSSTHKAGSYFDELKTTEPAGKEVNKPLTFDKPVNETVDDDETDSMVSEEEDHVMTESGSKPSGLEALEML